MNRMEIKFLAFLAAIGYAQTWAASTQDVGLFGSIVFMAAALLLLCGIFYSAVVEVRNRRKVDAAAKSVAAGLPTAGPSVTIEHIESLIVAEYFFTAEEATKGCPQMPSLKLLTFCVLVLRNGFTVTGESACVSPENFDKAKGEKYAREKAIEKLWSLEGYLLRNQLNEAAGKPWVGVDMGSPETDSSPTKAEIDEIRTNLQAMPSGPARTYGLALLDDIKGHDTPFMKQFRAQVGDHFERGSVPPDLVRQETVRQMVENADAQMRRITGIEVVDQSGQVATPKA